MNDDLIRSYNYDHFVHEKIARWFRFGESPPLMQPVDDFPLTALDGSKTSLLAELKKSRHTIIEFGSYT